ncbi:hypothetical protein [uncultured Helicobacter sp.]|uniref:hypothetical protein n=1 Tax=uncultured Helicobacter sp. TaxID=175537 RepID=UPI002627CDEA|nr:hypothetical protein [uncultured Helicobacter sp.]
MEIKQKSSLKKLILQQNFANVFLSCGLRYKLGILMHCTRGIEISNITSSSKDEPIAN